MPDYDIRRQSRAQISQSQTQSARDLQRQAGAGTTVKLNAVSGGVSQLFRLGGYLTSGNTASPSTIVTQYLAEHRALFGLSQEAIASFKNVAQDRDGSTGVTHLYLQQQINRLEVFGTSLKGHVDATGRLISIEANYFPGTTNPNGKATVSAQDALTAALQATLPDMLAKAAPHQAPAQVSPNDACHCLSPVGTAYRFPTVLQAESGPDRLTKFDKGPFAEPIRVRQVIFPTAAGSRLAWQIEIHAPSHLASYVLLVDASTRELLYRTNTYRFAANSHASVFLKNPDETPLSIQNYFGNPAFSPQGWSSGLATIGNNVQSDSATSTDDFIFPFADAWKTTGPNNFDRAGQRIRFTPVDALATAYTVTIGAAGSTAPAATNLLPFFTNTDDGTINLICGGGWTANILGATFTSFFVNTNGSLSFGGGITDSFPSKVSFNNDARRIAALWRDLNPGGGGTLTGDCAPEGGGTRIRIVWENVPNFPSGGSHTFAIVVHGIGTGLDNVIDIDYGAVSSPTGELVGVGGNSGTPFDPQTTGIVSYRDLGNAPVTPIAGGIAQTFPDPDLNESITNFGYHLNFAHDFFYSLGFNEAAGNYQLSNFNGGGAPLDPVQAEAQYSLGVFNNAFFQFAPDGTPGFTAFGLFSTGGGTCRRDSGLDSGVVYHEFTHGVTTRMVGGPQNVNTLNSFQGGALGEGWSDAFAFNITDDPVLGAYVICDPAGIRSAPYDANPAKYGDFGNKDGPFTAGIGQIFVPEVHLDGEIWASAIWDVHTALGEPLTSKLLFEALRYTPQEPSMVDAKNAVLLADQTLFNGTHVTTLYGIFAARGLGASASSSAGSFDNQPLLDGWTTTVFAAFDRPSNRYQEPGTTLFFDNFDGPPQGWATAGVDGAGGGPLWHLSSRRASSATKAYYYGQEATGNYNTGFRNYGSLISPPIVLPALVSNQALRLEWDQFRATGDSFFFDAGVVRIIEVGPGTRSQVSFVQNTMTSFGDFGYVNQRVNLNAFAGKTIQVEFFMDTFDSIANAAEGWYVDNVRISKLNPALQLTAAASRKKHGASGAGSNFSIPMPLTATLFSGTSGVEDRNGGDSDGGGTGDYKIVLTFNNPVTGGAASVTAHNPGGAGGTAGAPSFSGNTMIIPLTGVTNAQVLRVTASNVTSGTDVLASVDVNVGFLIGDTTGNRAVNSSDVGQTKSRSGQTANSTNFRSDVTVNGAIVNSSDVALVKSKSGTSCP